MAFLGLLESFIHLFYDAKRIMSVSCEIEIYYQIYQGNAFLGQNFGGVYEFFFFMKIPVIVMFKDAKCFYRFPI